MKRLIAGLVVLGFLAGCGGGTTTVTTAPPCAASCPKPPPVPTVPTPSPPPTPAGALGPAVGPVLNHAANPACGTEGWAKKTLTDSQASSVNSTPSPTTIAAIAGKAGHDGSTRLPYEAQVWTITAQLQKFKIEADSDVHLVVGDGSKTMIVEFPASTCFQGSADQAASQGMADARAALVKACGQPSSGGFATISGTATISGVGFYDRDHGQTGRLVVSPGATAELHPVIGFSSTGCQHTGAAAAVHADVVG